MNNNKIINKKSKLDIFSKILVVFFTIVMIVYAISLLIPIIWMFNNSLKGFQEYYLTPSYSLPDNIIQGFKDNYFGVFDRLAVTRTLHGKGRVTFTFWTMLENSVILSISLPMLTNFLSLICAYVIAKYKFPGRNFLYSFGIIIMILPLFGSGTTSLLIRKTLGIYDNMALMILTAPCTAFSGLYFLMFYAAFKVIPWDYAEAVFLDGGGNFRAFISIMFPMVFKTYGVVCLLGFLGTWADYSWFLVYLPSYANLAYGVYLLQENLMHADGATVPEFFAVFTVICIPTALLYISIHRFFMGSFQVGGLKG